MKLDGSLDRRRVFALAIFAGVAGASWFVLHRGSSSETSPASIEDPVAIARANGKPTIAEFGSNACQSCRQMKPVLRMLAHDHGDRLNVVDVDLLSTEGRPLIRKYRIAMMPTQLLFDSNGVEVARNFGAITGEGLLDLLVSETKPPKVPGS